MRILFWGTPEFATPPLRALIGEGHIGDAPFRRIMTESRLRDVPKILETPKGDDMVTNDRRMLAKLRGFAAA